MSKELKQIFFKLDTMIRFTGVENLPPIPVLLTNAYLAGTNVPPLLRIFTFHSARIVCAIFLSLCHPLKGGKKRNLRRYSYSRFQERRHRRVPPKISFI
jgi:hypothetical protein